MNFVSWDFRPAVISSDNLTAFAVLEPGAEWTRVDALDVYATAAVLTEDAWRARFRTFGPLDVSALEFSGGLAKKGAK